MAYRTNNSCKHERERGMAAMRKLTEAAGFDPQATLAVAQQNLDAFGKLDDLDNSTFIKCMDDLRKNHPISTLFSGGGVPLKRKPDGGRRRTGTSRRRGIEPL